MPSVPPQLQEVPAIVIDNKRMHQGKAAFEWLKNNVQMYLSAGPELNAKGGYKIGPSCGDLGFSFLGSSSPQEYNSGWSPLDAKNGSEIDKNKFDPSTGKPKPPGGNGKKASLPSMDELQARRNQEVPMPARPQQSYER